MDKNLIPLGLKRHSVVFADMGVTLTNATWNLLMEIRNTQRCNIWKSVVSQIYINNVHFEDVRLICGPPILSLSAQAKQWADLIARPGLQINSMPEK